MESGVLMFIIAFLLLIALEFAFYSFFGKISKNNVIELVLYKAGEEERVVIEKDFLKAVDKKAEFEEEGYVVVLQITTKSGLKL